MRAVTQDFLRSVGKAPLAAAPPGLFSWLTVHDTSTSYHGRHYHREQAMTAVLYLHVSNESVRSLLQSTVTDLTTENVPVPSRCVVTRPAARAGGSFVHTILCTRHGDIRHSV